MSNPVLHVPERAAAVHPPPVPGPGRTGATGVPAAKRSALGWGRGRPKAGTTLLGVGAAFFTLLIAVPVLAIFVRVLPQGALWAAATRPVVLEALQLSFETTLLTLVLSILLGTPLAYLLARHRFPGQTLVDSLIELPMVLPP